MLHKPVIKNFISGLLVLVFALSITPRIMLHALVAHHTDIHSHADGSTDLLSTAGFSCDVNSQVVESPFLDFSLPVLSVVIPVFTVSRQGIYQSFLSSAHFIFGLRGPPTVTV